MSKQTLKSISTASKEVEQNILKNLGGKPLSPEEVLELLSTKAETSKIELLDGIKADKIDLENYKYVFTHNNNQMINLIAILIEYLQLTIPKGSIAENVSTSKRGNILKRMYHLFQKVNNNGDLYQKSKYLVLKLKGLED